MTSYPQDHDRYVRSISESRLNIYDHIKVGDSDAWIPTPILEDLLNDGLKGMPVKGMPIRTRSKVVKQAVCQILGYPVPKSFKKTQPRFFGQQFDIYIQKSNNLQIWNEEIAPTRRYVIIRVSDNDIIERVKVVTGETLALLDKTGTLTQKYQARVVTRLEATELLTKEDTANIQPVIKKSDYSTSLAHSPADSPTSDALLPIAEVYDRLTTLVGAKFADPGRDQERNRGAELHRQICRKLGYREYQDIGSFPDIPNQLLEVKLQTSPTIDLGLVLPNSQDPLDIPKIDTRQVRHCDVRYAVFYAQTDGEQVQLTHFYLTTGEAFFKFFRQFQGQVLNKKLQIPLPDDFFT